MRQQVIQSAAIAAATGGRSRAARPAPGHGEPSAEPSGRLAVLDHSVQNHTLAREKKLDRSSGAVANERVSRC